MTGATLMASILLASGFAPCPQAVALVIYGLVNAWAIAGGAWFGPVGWPRTPSRLLKQA